MNRQRRLTRLEALKQLIASGSYEVDTLAVAEALMMRLDLTSPSWRGPAAEPSRGMPPLRPQCSGDVLEPG